MSCWHAAARMIWAFKFRQSINPLGKTYAANTGLSPADITRLAKTLGLETIPSVNASYSWEGLAELLRKHGPLWVVGYWDGPLHAIVITGVEPDGSVYANDPAKGRRQETIMWFNTKLAKFSDPIMYLPNSRGTTQGYATYFADH